MSVIILGVGVPLVVMAALAICEEEFIKIVKELISLLVRTMKYSTDEIVHIIRFYCN